MKKKLLFFGYTLEMGGAEKVLVDFINILNKDYEIDLVLLQKKGELLNSLPKNVDVYEIRKNNFTYALFRYISFFRKWKINRIANRKNYDVAIGFLEGRSATWVADIRKPIRKLAWVHNDVDKFDIGISEKEIKKSYKKMDKVVTVSVLAKENFCCKYQISFDDVTVLYNLIDENVIKEKANEKIEKNNVFTFVNVGKMRPQKRQDRLIEIARDLKEENYKFKIQIVGNGPEEEKLKKMVEDYGVSDVIELVGLQLNPYPYIKNADCVVVSSDFEGYSVSIKEALALKKVIISTDVSGVKEMFDKDKYGIVCETSTEALKEKMKDILDGKIDTKKIEKNLEKFDCGNEEIIKKLRKIIEGK